MKKHALLAAATALLIPTTPAHADVLNAGDTLRVDFTASNFASPPPNALRFVLGLVDVLAPFTTRTATLYDNGVPLGVHADTLFGNHMGALSLNPSNTFATTSSPYTFLNPAIVDFTSILSGSIVGRIEFTLETGAMDINLSSVDVTLLAANAPSGGTPVSPSPTLTSVVIIGSNPGADFCFGDGGDQLGCTPCPCGNDAVAPADGGCSNSAGMSARLWGAGTPSMASSDLRFEVSGVLPQSFGILISGSGQAPANVNHPCATQNPGSGLPSSSLDGLRCVVQNVLRHGVRSSDATGNIGMTNDGWGDFDPFVQFSTFTPGQSRYFQVVYAENGSQICQTGLDTTQGFAVTFIP